VQPGGCRDRTAPVAPGQVGDGPPVARRRTYGLAIQTSAALVRSSDSVLTPLIEQLNGTRVAWLPGYRVKIIDGHCMEASARCLKALREVPGGPLPGKSLMLYEPAHGVVHEVFPCEDGHTQERSLFDAVLAHFFPTYGSTLPSRSRGPSRSPCPASVCPVCMLWPWRQSSGLLHAVRGVHV
jgi:hypothetical protein